MPGEVLDLGRPQRRMEGVLHVPNRLALVFASEVGEDVRAARGVVTMQPLEDSEGSVAQWDRVRMARLGARHPEHLGQAVDLIPPKAKQITAPQTGVDRERDLFGKEGRSTLSRGLDKALIFLLVQVPEPRCCPRGSP